MNGKPPKLATDLDALRDLFQDIRPGSSTALPQRTASARIGVTADGDFCIAPADRRSHTHIIGGTKRGKSVFMEQQIRRDLEDPDCSLCLIDPHNGSVYDSLVRYIAYERPDLARRVVLFHPAGDGEQIMGFNPLGKYARENPHYALNMIVSACLKAWGQDRTDRTPRITRWLENIFFLLIANQLTLLECAPLISTRKQNPHRDTLLRSVRNFFIEEDWNDFTEATNTIRQQYLEGAHNRLRKFLRNPYLRRVFGQQSQILDMDRIRDERKILLVKLPDGKRIDRESNQLVGILLINEIFRTILDRDPQGDPHPFYLYIDEFGQFASREIAYLLEEARKYGLYLTIAHQHLAQLREEDEYLYASVLTNCHNRVVLGGLSYEDAQILDREVNTGFQDLKAIKDHIWQTKFRPVQEWQQSFGISHGENSGHSAGWSLAFGESLSTGRALARSLTHGVTETKGSSEQTTESRGRSTSSGRTEQEGTSAALGVSNSRNESSGTSRSRSTTEGSSDSKGHTDSQQQGSSSGTTDQESHQKGDSQQMSSVPGGGMDLTGMGSHESAGSAHGKQRSESASSGTADSTSHTRSRSVSTQTGENQSQGTQQGVSATQGANKSRGTSMQQGEQRAVAVALGRQHSRAESRTDGETRTENVSAGLSRQEGISGSVQRGESRTANVSWQLGTRHEEFREATPVYWSLQEIQHLGIGLLMRQPIGTAVFQIGTNAPVQVRIDYRPPLPYHPEYTPERLRLLEGNVFRAHPDFYLRPDAALQEIAARQQQTFGGVLEFDFGPEPAVPADDESPPARGDHKPRPSDPGDEAPILFADDEA